MSRSGSWRYCLRTTGYPLPAPAKLQAEWPRQVPALRRWRRPSLPHWQRALQLRSRQPEGPGFPRLPPSPGLPALPPQPGSARPASAPPVSRARPDERPGFARPVLGHQSLLPKLRRGHSPPASQRPADRRAAAPASAAGRCTGGQTSAARTAPVAREGWQIPHARHATGRRRQAQKPGPTWTGQSR